MGSYSGVYFDLAGNGSGNLETAGTSASLSTGWISIEGQANGFGGLAVFRSSAAGRPDTEATSPMRTSPPAESRSFLFDNRNGITTGVALANFDPTSPTLQYLDVPRLAMKNRSPVHGSDAPGAGELRSFSLSDKYPTLAGAVGTVEIDSAGIVSLGLRFNPKGSFTSIQVMEKPQ